MYQPPRSHLYFSDPPHFDELCLVTVTVPAISRDPNKPRSLQPQIIKCRELIFTEPDILASPSLDNETQVDIIMQKSMYKSGKLSQRFHRMGIQAAEPRMISAAELQFCLNYTMLAKLAPSWNKVGDQLIQGRDFLLNRQKLNAVDYQLTINELEMFLSLEAHVFRMPPLQLSDLDIAKPVLYEFLATREKIDEFSIQRQWCHILPSMKKGQIVSVSHQLPQDCPYKSYRDLKRFWKNTYGYRLPEDDTNMIYYQVYFRPLGGTLFTYPECCLRTRPPTYLQRPDEVTIIQAFLSDLHNKMPSICGRKLKFSTLANYTSCELVHSDQVEDLTGVHNQPNLSQHRPEHWRPGVNIASHPHQNPSQIPDITTKPVQNYSQVDSNASQSALRNNIQNSDISQSAATMTQPSCQSQLPNSSISQSAATATNPNTNKETITLPSEAAQINVTKTVPRFKPSFKTRLPTAQVKQTTQKQLSSGPRTVPSFKPMKPVHPGGTPQLSQPSTGSVSKPHVPHPVKRPSFQIRDDPDIYELNITQTVRPSFNSTPKPTALAPKFAPKITKPQTPKVTQTPKSKKKIPSTPKKVQAKTPSTPKMNANYSLSDSGYGSSLLCSPMPNSACSQLPGSQDMIPPTPSTPVMKRPADPSGTPVAKKPRAKPKVQENVDVEALARSNTLNKVNTITLMAWLKDKGVPCKAKDKKGELVEKTLRHLNLLPTPEP